MTITIDNYNKQIELAEQARLELRDLIEKKTGHSCAPRADAYPYKGEFSYSILCFSPRAVIDISSLFTDEPKYQEKIDRCVLTGKRETVVSSDVEGLGSPLEIYATLSSEQYIEWKGLIGNE